MLGKAGIESCNEVESNSTEVSMQMLESGFTGKRRQWERRNDQAGIQVKGAMLPAEGGLLWYKASEGAPLTEGMSLSFFTAPGVFFDFDEEADDSDWFLRFFPKKALRSIMVRVVRIYIYIQFGNAKGVKGSRLPEKASGSAQHASCTRGALVPPR